MVAVIIYNENHKHMEKFFQKGGKYGARRYYRRVKRLFEDKEVEIKIISLINPSPLDPDKKQRKGELWCGYCREFRKFKRGEYGTRECPVCGISDADFYVRNHNHLWRKAGYKHARRKK